MQNVYKGCALLIALLLLTVCSQREKTQSEQPGSDVDIGSNTNKHGGGTDIAPTISDIYWDMFDGDSRLVHVAVDRVWDGVFAAGTSDNYTKSYVVAECIVHELLYAHAAEGYPTITQDRLPPQKGDRCYIWFFLSFDEQVAAAGYDRFRSFLEEAGSLIVYGDGNPRGFRIGTENGQAVAQEYSGAQGKEWFTVFPMIRVERLKSWEVIPIRDGSADGAMMEDLIKAVYGPDSGMTTALNKHYTCGYFFDGDELSDVLSGFRRYVTDASSGE